MKGIPTGWTKTYYNGHPAIRDLAGWIIERIPDWPPSNVVRYRVWSAPKGLPAEQLNLGVYEQRSQALKVVEDAQMPIKKPTQRRKLR